MSKKQDPLRIKTRERPPRPESPLRGELAGAAEALGIELPTFLLEKRAPAGKASRPDEAGGSLTLIARALSRHLGLGPADPLPYDPEWLPDGRLQFAATPEPGLGLSLAQSENHALCIIGEWRQGCGLRQLDHTWSGSDERVEDDSDESESREILKARVECARDAVARSGADRLARLTFVGRHGNAVLFEFRTEAGKQAVVTHLLRSADQTRMIVAMTVRADGRKDERSTNVAPEPGTRISRAA